MSFLKRTTTTRILFFMASDALLVSLSVWCAFFIRFDGIIPAAMVPFVGKIILLELLFVIPIFYLQNLYFFSWAYVSANEAISLVKSITVAFFFVTVTVSIAKYFPEFYQFPRSTIFISYLLVLLFCGGLRFAKRIWRYGHAMQGVSHKERTLIVGAGDAGEQIVRNIFSAASAAYYPVGFVDDNAIKQGVKIHGLQVLGKIADIPNIVQEHEIRQIIVALPSANNKVIRAAVELGKQAGVRKIKIAPPMHEIIRGEISLKNLRDVDVEDLLGREEITLDKTKIESFIQDKVVLVTGAAGSIGSELSRQIAKFKPQSLLLLDQDETGIFTISKELGIKFPGTSIVSHVADVTDQGKMAHLFEHAKPNIVFHAAAYKHVPLMEDAPTEAVKNNVIGTQILAEASLAHGVERFIFISTDKAVNPTSVMGATKRLGEMICQTLSQQAATKFISVRFGNVLNSRGSVIPIFKDQIRRGGPVEVTHPDMQRYFMLTSEACLLVMQAGAMGQGGEVFVLDMGKAVKIVDLAREMIILSGFEPDKDIAIVYIGMRPGEKLFEEILTAEEGTAATHHQKIFTAKLAPIDIKSFKAHLASLKKSTLAHDKEEVVAILRNIIPFYTNV